jgi:hypothetical protein
MFKKKYKQVNYSANKSKLDQVIWFIENYLPQKKERPEHNLFYRDHLNVKNINQLFKLASLSSKKLLPITKNTTISFTFGNWALPYLKLLKKIGIVK